MKYIALFFPAILSMRIEYKQSGGETWNWVEYLYKYIFFVICNVLLTESLVVYIFKKAVTIEAFESFPFFTKYLLASSMLAVALPRICKVVKENISVSFEIHRNTDGKTDRKSKTKKDDDEENIFG